MAGQMSFGAELNNAGAGRLSQSKAFCEGRKAKADGDLVGTNPHPSLSPDSVAWLLGFADVSLASTTSCAV